MEEIREFIISRAIETLLSEATEKQAVERFKISFKDVELVSLVLEILPARYQKNQNIFSTGDQLTLLKSHVAVIGCGEAGSCIIEHMARLGIGKITVYDPENYKGDNFNQQLNCDMNMIGEPKVNVTQARVKDINPAVEIVPVNRAFEKETDVNALEHVKVLIDTVDTFQTRIDLAETCCKINVPLINGALGSWFDYAVIKMPRNPIGKIVYKDHMTDFEIETSLGNPANIPGVIVEFQLAEICRIILGRSILPEQKLIVDA